MLQQRTQEATLPARIESEIRRSTHGRIRDLSVELISGQYHVRGSVPSHHTKQLALRGALELLSHDRFADGITVCTMRAPSESGEYKL